jgi:hypothetical protein
MATVTSKRTYHRPNTNIPFWFNQEFTDYLQTHYRNTGKIISFDIVLSEDELTQVRTIVWKDQATLDEFNADQNLFDFINERETHMDTNNLITDLEITTA